MRRLLIIFLFLSSSCLALAEESKVTAGMPIAAVEEILTKNGFEFGGQFMEQVMSMRKIMGIDDDLWVRLDNKATLSVAFDKRTKNVVSLAVVLRGGAPKTGSIIHPDAAIFTPQSYALVFKKEPDQQSVPAQTNTQATSNHP